MRKLIAQCFCQQFRSIMAADLFDDYSKRLFPGKVNSCFFLTMNAPKMYADAAYHGIMEQYAGAMKRFGGSSEFYAACDTLQFRDYTKFAAGTFNEEHKRMVHETQFHKDLEAACEIGFRLAKAAGK